MLAATIQRSFNLNGILERVAAFVRARLPSGRALPKDVWEHQHRAILVLLWLHAVGIFCDGLISSAGIWISGLESAPVAIAALLAGVVKGGRRFRAALATLGLLTSSAVLVHLSGGFTEMHFHLFLIMVIVALYQDWVPFTLAIGYVLLEYLAMGVLAPQTVIGREAVGGDPWQSLLVHLAFVVAACVAGLVHWRLDATNHARAEAARSRLVHEQAAREDAEQAVRARDDLVSEISHDLKNPLGAVKGYAQLIRRRVSPTNGTTGACDVESAEKIEATATRIDATANQMASTIDELLDLVRVEMGESIELDRRIFDLVACARRVAAEQQASTQHHRVLVESRLPGLTGSWDEPRLERALRNLVANAVKYSPSGDVRIIVRAENGREGRWAVIDVRDEGPGISPADLPFLFDRLHRVHRQPGGRVEGQGVGLASARAVVEAHGGKISVASQLGAGSTFTIRLPR